MNAFFKDSRDLSKELNCSWGDKNHAHLLKVDLSVEENLAKAMSWFPMLEKMVNNVLGRRRKRKV